MQENIFGIVLRVVENEPHLIILENIPAAELNKNKFIKGADLPAGRIGIILLQP